MQKEILTVIAKEQVMSQNKNKPAMDLQKEIEDLKKTIAALNLESASPMSYTPTPSASVSDDASENFSNRFDVPKKLREEIVGKGYNYKFINFSKFKRDAVHKSHWIPYKPDKRTVQDMLFGLDPDGYVVRGDCVLAVRPLSVDKKAKAAIQSRNDRLNSYNDMAKSELQAYAAEHGIKAKISSGYEED